MDFKEAIKKLGIEKYSERIFNSNSRGELRHLSDYIVIAENIDDSCSSWFPEWFNEVVKYAEGNWKRPESIFQHIPEIIIKTCEEKEKMEGDW